MSPRSLWLLCLLAAAWVGGCARHYIANTDVEENDFNRRVIEFCEEYRHAVEGHNVGLLLKFAHPRYYEDGATVDTSDDLDYAGLRMYLDDKFRKTKAIRYEVRYRNVQRAENGNVLVDFTFSASYKVPMPDGDVWRRRVADNRLELVAAGDQFRILSGM